MAYFKCTIGGASGDGVALIIECDPSFAGSVITADNGEDVFTDTCPSVAPYTVKFDGIPTGTYTISGVSGGETITKQFTVLDYTVSLHVIPDGATATPTDDIQTWLHCADIWDKNYTTIAQVLADVSTLQALIASNNAADYMARSTTWASSVTANANAMTYIGANNYCANKLLSNSTWLNAICNSTYFESVLNVEVPTMTSNTTPSGVASCENVDTSSYVAYYVFDGAESSTWWVPRTIDAWIGYEFPNAMIIKKLYIYNMSGSNRPFTAILKGSNDGNTWVELTDNISILVGDRKNIVVDNANAYKHYRLYTHGTNGMGGLINELQFYGRA